MTRLYAAVALAALAFSSAPAAAQGQVVFRPDVATFRYTEDQSLVELYLSFRAESLPFTAAEGGFEARVPAHVVVRPVSQAAPGGTGAPNAYDETLAFAYVLADTAALASNQVFVEQVRMAVTPGEYEVDVTLQPEGAAEVRALLNLTVPDYAESGGTAISAIQLATAIRPSTDPTDPLAKSGLVVRPNPDAFYGGTGATIQYYTEVYAPPTEADTYTLLSFLSESEAGGALPDHQDRLTRQVRPVDVVVGRMDVSALPSGIYHLRLVVLNEANEAVAEQSKRLFVINPDVERPQLAGGLMTYEETLFAAMGQEELELNVRHARVLATAREQAQMETLVSDDDRRAFLTAFWVARDDDGLPNANEARRTFYNRLRYVNDRFGSFQREAFETDRGRVYLTYGPPTEVDRRLFESDAYPHEIWKYDNLPGEGRSLFVFVDRYTSNQFDLLHSDVTGETSLPQWEKSIIR